MAYKQLKLSFDTDLAVALSKKINLVDAQFNTSAFIKGVSRNLEPLELKDRIELFADQLYNAFDQDYKSAITTLLKILGPENENETGMFKIYYWILPIAKVVEKYGQSAFKLSMKAIEEITKRSTGEYAIRPFLLNQQDKTMKQISQWSKHENSHVRRLASEGIRPRLPWASKLDAFIQDPSSIIPVLNNLKADKSKYVQKSVANCINDILKDNMALGIKLIENWMQPTCADETKWIIKHAIRRLLKQNDSWAILIEAKLKTKKLQ